MSIDKNKVKEFWNEASCGEKLYFRGENEKEKFHNQLKSRYELEPFIIPFAGFEESKGEKVLEVGVGMGADHQMFAEKGAILYGCDITERGVDLTTRRFELLRLQTELIVADVEGLPYADDSFDKVYSYGVIHHSPNTKKAAQEIWRVVKPGGKARVMIYHKYSMVGFMLWLRYGLLRFRPFLSLGHIYSRYLESPGTKAYSVAEAKDMFSSFSQVSVQTLLSHADLLTSEAGQRHKGALLSIARKIYPRYIIRKFFPRNGLCMLITLVK